MRFWMIEFCFICDYSKSSQVCTDSGIGHDLDMAMDSDQEELEDRSEESDYYAGAYAQER